MPDHIVQALLHNAVQAKRNALRQGGRNIYVCEIDSKPVILSQFGAQTSHGGNESKVNKFGGMQVVSDSMELTRDLFGLIKDRPDSLAEFVVLFGKILSELLQLDRNQ